MEGSAVGDEVARAAAGFVAALLPAPENRRFAVRHGADAARWSAVIGAVEAPLGIGLFVDGAIAFVTGQSAILGGLLLEHWVPGLDEGHLMGTGLVALLAWFLYPLAWFLALQATTGVLRLVAFGLGREPIGEPLVWAALRAGQLAAGLGRRSAQTRRLGPWRPDRLHRDRGCDLEILSCRPRPEWEDGGTLEVDGRFFRLLDSSERADGVHTAVAYRFRELDERELIRNPMPYVPLEQ